MIQVIEEELIGVPNEIWKKQIRTARWEQSKAVPKIEYMIED